MSAPKRTPAKPLLAALLMTLAVTGCQSNWNPWKKKPEPPILPPALSLTATQFAGSVLSGPSATPPDDAALSAAWGVSFRIITASAVPGPPFKSVGPSARLVVGSDPSDVLSPSAQLVYTLKALELDQKYPLEHILDFYGPWDEQRTLSGTVAVGSASSFNIALPDDTEKNATFSRRAVRVEVSRSKEGNAYELAISSEDLTLPGLTPGREKVVYERSVTIDQQQDRLAIALPMAFANSPSKALVLDLAITGKASADQFAAAKTEVAASASKVAEQIKEVPPTPEQVAVAKGLEAISAQPANRGALAFLADETGAVLTKGVVLVADDDVLKLITEDIRKRSPNLKKKDKASVGWMLDRSTITAVGQIKEEDQPRLMPPVQGALTAYAGEVGRQLDLLQSLAAQSVSSRDLDAHIIAEHRIALEDNSPALRVRAYDWLNERGQGPAGYDPLGKPRERRAALDKFNEATTQPSAAGTTSATSPSTQP